MEEELKPAFALSLMCGILMLPFGICVAIGGVYFYYSESKKIVSDYAGSIMREVFFHFAVRSVILGLFWLISGAIMIYGALMIKSGEPSKVMKGSAIVLIFSGLSFLSAFFVNGVGTGVIGGLISSFFGLLGGVLGLAWKPVEKAP
jgi:uncharacterized membrane protein HdeD (DUF308 family)